MARQIGERAARSEIRTDHYVRTGDGALGKVTYVSPTDATLYLVDEATLDLGEQITLPLGELRRVADPTNKRPPIEGMPAERPVCAYCGRQLKPEVHNHYDEAAKLWKRRIVRRTFEGWRSYEGAFDTTACAIAFAGASWRAGFRRKRGRS